jgi:adenylate cyclase
VREIDFEREGLLDGLDGGNERAARRELLERLVEAGAGIDQLKRAVEQDRLALLPMELLFEAECRHTVAEVAREAGVDVDFLIRDLVASGVPRPEPDDRVLGDQELEAARALPLVFDSGMSEEQVLKLSSIFGNALSQVVDAVVEVALEDFMRPGDTELDYALRLGDVARNLVPTLGPFLQATAHSQLRERIAHEIVGRAEIAAGRLPGSRPVTVGFADLVGFTSLSERADVEQVSELVARFTDTAAQVAEAPVRLVKMIGDEAMLAAPDPEPLLASLLDLVDAAGRRGLPELRVGVAAGTAIERAGDWYGRPVNLASRITDNGRPGAVLASEDVVERVDSGFAFEHVGEASLKGIDGPVALYRVTRG